MKISYQIRVTYTRIFATLMLLLSFVLSWKLGSEVVFSVAVPTFSGLLALDNFGARKQRANDLGQNNKPEN